MEQRLFMSPTARHQFGTLQHKTFPIYFVQSMAISAALLSVWVFKHPDVLTHIRQPKVADVAQAYALASVLLSQGFNYFVIGPMTSRCVHYLPSVQTDITQITCKA